MAPSLRRKLVCFYCGSRSSQVSQKGLRQWECNNCEAINHLDEVGSSNYGQYIISCANLHVLKKGEITDPPVLESSKVVQYAHTIPRAASHTPLTSTDETLFCQTCVQNQYLITQLLASYLPPTSDGNDGDYDSNFPDYRARLEEQYPQVCEDCEPRVRDRIRATGYAAKTDHLRRMMERTREIKAQKASSSWGWKNALVAAGALVWWGSLVGQIFWDVMGVLVKLDYEDGLRAENTEATLGNCITQFPALRTMEPACVAAANPIAEVALLMGLASMWWNNRLSERIEHPSCDMVGLSEYYKLQVIVLVARIGVWYYLQAPAGIDPAVVRAAHLFLLMFLIIVSTPTRMATLWLIISQVYHHVDAHRQA